MAGGLVGREDDPDKAGVLGEGATGVYGRNTVGVGNGVIGYSEAGRAVWGHAASGDGVRGESVNGTGVHGQSAEGVAVWAESTTYEGVHAVTKSPVTAAVAAYNLNEVGTGAAIFARKLGTAGFAGFFDGPVYVTGEVTVGGALHLAGADYAESLTAAPNHAIIEGMVVVIDEDGRIQPCESDYDPRAAGVVSGAEGVPAAVVLDRHDAGVPVAMMGKLWVLADATYGAIKCGDMLTTSATFGHARLVVDRERAFGAVIGKALTTLAAGTGLVRALVVRG